MALHPLRKHMTIAVCEAIEEKCDENGWSAFSEGTGQAASLILPGGCGCLMESFERGMRDAVEDLLGQDALIWWQLEEHVLIERAVACFEEDGPGEPFAMEAFGVRGYPDCYQGEACDNGEYAYQMLGAALDLAETKTTGVVRGLAVDRTGMP